MEKITRRLKPKQKILKLFPAFRYKNYRYYFVGQAVSLVGTWLQTVAQGWLILQLTNSAYMVGMVAALNFLPVLFFGMFSGSLIDRMDKRKLLIGTQACEMLLALTLGILTLTGLINPFIIGVLSFLNGFVHAIDMPARQSFTVDLVGVEQLPSAIAINMGTFNAARVVGPAIAGILIAWFGLSTAFLVNGLSFIGPIIALYFMNLKIEIPKTTQHPLKSIEEGMKYTFSHGYIRNLLFLIAITSIFGFSYTTIMPVIAQNVFHTDASGLGILYSVAGLGAVAATVFVSGFHKHFEVEKLIFGGSLVSILSILVFSFLNNFYLALPFLFLIGGGMAIQIAMINSSIQFHVKHQLRGRVMGIYSLFLLGMQPLGSFLVGYLTEHFGSQLALSSGAIVMLAFTIYMLTRIPKLHKKAMLAHASTT